MKLKNLFTILPLAASVALFSACPDNVIDEPDPTPDPIYPDNPDNPTPDTGKELSPEDQKEFLETVATDFMKLTPESDFQTIANFTNFCIEEFDDDNCDWDTVEDWAEDVWDALLVKKGTSQEEEKYDWGAYTYIYTNYDLLVAASNFTGHFDYANHRWKKTAANDLQFTFNDNKGNKCVASLKTTGGKKVHLGHFEEYDYGNSDYDPDTWYGNYVEYYDNYDVTITVPSTITLTIKQGNTTLVSTNVNIDLSSLSSNEFTTTSKLSLTAVTEFHNGYKMEVSQCKYDAGNTATAQFAFSNKAGTLISGGISGKAYNLPNFNITNDTDDVDFDDTTGEVTYAKLDIMGRVQMQGTVSDIRKYCDYLDEAYEYDNNKNQMQNWLNKANRLADINIYYNGSTTKQASVTLEAVLSDSWNGYEYYDYTPVLNFADGSRYSTFESFFNEDDFSVTIALFKRLANRYADLFDEVDRPFSNRRVR